MREGRLEYAPHITDKAQAEADAKRRRQKDPGLHRIAYYEVHEDGIAQNPWGYLGEDAVRIATDTCANDEPAETDEPSR